MGKARKRLSFAELTVESVQIGEECYICVSGGGRPHIGCVVLAVPRPSLRDPEAVSVTSSVLNVTGHKDEYLCRQLAEAAAKKKNSVAVCTGGFHADGITEEQIRELMDAVRQLTEEELEWLM